MPELGLVVLKPGREPYRYFIILECWWNRNQKACVSAIRSRSCRSPAAGGRQNIVPFFSNERVIRAAGGVGALSTGYYVMLHPASGLMAITITLNSHSPLWYRRNGVVLALRQQLRDQTSESLELLAQQNLTAG